MNDHTIRTPPPLPVDTIVRDEYSKTSNGERQDHHVAELEAEVRTLRHQVESLRAVARTVVRVAGPYVESKQR